MIRLLDFKEMWKFLISKKFTNVEFLIKKKST